MQAKETVVRSSNGRKSYGLDISRLREIVQGLPFDSGDRPAPGITRRARKLNNHSNQRMKAALFAVGACRVTRRWRSNHSQSRFSWRIKGALKFPMSSDAEKVYQDMTCSENCLTYPSHRRFPNIRLISRRFYL